MEHELIDYFDEEGKFKGVIDKAVAHKNGLWHRSVHVWIINSKNQILLQKRCAAKKFYPEFWDCSFAGHIGAGECSVVSAIREGEEELGLKLKESDLKYAFTLKEKLVWKDIDSREFVDVYLMEKDLDINDLSYQKEEVESAKFFDLNDLFNGKIEKLFPHEDEYRLLNLALKNRLNFEMDEIKDWKLQG